MKTQLPTLTILIKTLTNMENSMQLFYTGDIVEFRDKSQWEITSATFEKTIDEFMYEFKNIKNGETDLESEHILDKKGHVVQFSDKMPAIERKMGKVYHMSDYRNKRNNGHLNARGE